MMPVEMTDDGTTFRIESVQSVPDSTIRIVSSDSRSATSSGKLRMSQAPASPDSTRSEVTSGDIRRELARHGGHVLDEERAQVREHRIGGARQHAVGAAVARLEEARHAAAGQEPCVRWRDRAPACGSCRRARWRRRSRAGVRARAAAAASRSAARCSTRRPSQARSPWSTAASVIGCRRASAAGR